MLVRVVALPKFAVNIDGDEILVFSTEEPIKGRVNKELIKELAKRFHAKVELVSGFTSRQKQLLIRNVEKRSRTPPAQFSTAKPVVKHALCQRASSIPCCHFIKGRGYSHVSISSERNQLLNESIQKGVVKRKRQV